MSDDYQHPTLQEYEASARATMEEEIRQGTPPELAGASYEANMYAETLPDLWHDQAEAAWQAADDARQARACDISGLGQAETELDAAWASGDPARIEAAEATAEQAYSRFEQVLREQGATAEANPHESEAAASNAAFDRQAEAERLADLEPELEA